jgi:outer membrane protein OmpA-like peptidoglycan-associated protein
MNTSIQHWIRCARRSLLRVFVGLLACFAFTTPALAVDFSAKVTLPTYGAVIKVNPSGQCSWVKQGRLEIDLAVSCRVRPYQGTMMIELKGFEISDYEVEILPALITGKKDYDVTVFVDSDVQLVVETPAQGYVHESFNDSLEFAVRLVGTEDVKRVDSVKIVESDEQRISKARRLKSLGAGIYSTILRPTKVCGNHTYTITAKGRLKSGKAFVRSLSLYIDAGGKDCRSEPLPEFSTFVVRFGLNKHTPDDDAETIRHEIAKRTQGVPHVAVIAGFASQEGGSKGHALRNLVLSKRRARSVRRMLGKLGLKALDKSIRCNAYGHRAPVAPNETEKGRAANRRVEVLLVPIGAAIPKNLWAGKGDDC